MARYLSSTETFIRRRLGPGRAEMTARMTVSMPVMGEEFARPRKCRSVVETAGWKDAGTIFGLLCSSPNSFWEDHAMRPLALALSTAALLTFPMSAFAQAIEVSPRGIEVEHEGRSVAPPECRELRKACLNKEELGEQGQGNCERYRKICRDQD